MPVRLHESGGQRKRAAQVFFPTENPAFLQRRHEIYHLCWRLSEDCTASRARALGHRYGLPFDTVLECNFKLQPGPRIVRAIANEFGLPISVLPQFKVGGVFATVKNCTGQIIALHDERMIWLGGSISVHVSNPAVVAYGVTLCANTFEADTRALIEPHRTAVGVNGTSEAVLTNTLAQLTVASRMVEAA